ncbi:hypothetical protein [Chryseobacterium sp. Marseille-Q3244]|uniref:hypothetical protein n=1 Tax=Chryseobacterium sp. Marseille-Q3244 TaxID=2758092 RepID=UPI00202573AE|nr:hypothetical protein [Chryseobacterium sp. Marseille-Q3244]
MDQNTWLQNFLTEESVKPDFNKIENVKNFTILWNLFERFFCDKEGSLSKIQLKLTDLKQRGYILPPQSFDVPYNYFRERYITNKQTNLIFEKLDFRDTKTEETFKESLKNCLEGETTVDYDKLSALLIITSRFRNNLFHGSKNIAKISEQEESFAQLNSALMSLLDFLKKSGKLSSVEEKL